MTDGDSLYMHAACCITVLWYLSITGEVASDCVGLLASGLLQLLHREYRTVAVYLED